MVNGSYSEAQGSDPGGAMPKDQVIMLLTLLVFVSIPVFIIIYRLIAKTCHFYGCKHRSSANQFDMMNRHSMRERVNNFLVSSHILDVMNWVQTFASLLSCIMYIIESYTVQYGSIFNIMELVLCSMFSADYGLRMYMAHNRLSHFFSTFSLIDLITIVPVLALAVYETQMGSQEGADVNVTFLRFLRLFRMFRLLRALKVFRSGPETGLQRQVFTVIFTILCMIFCFTGLYQILESFSMEDGTQTTQQHEFHKILYFMTIEIMGRPNIPAQTLQGYVCLMLLVFASLVFIPPQLSTLINIANQSNYVKYFVKDFDRKHIIITGVVTHASLSEFLADFFHEDHGVPTTHVVILTMETPTPEIQILLQSPKYEECVTYIVGSPYDASDLRRVQVSSAAACFVLCDKFALDQDTQDIVTVGRVLALKAIQPSLVCHVQLLRVKHKEHILAVPHWQNEGTSRIVLPELSPPSLSQLCCSPVSSTVLPSDEMQMVSTRRDSVLCIEKMKGHLFGTSCLCAGMSTLISNLFCTFSAEMEWPGAMSEPPWAMAYIRGCAHEVYMCAVDASVRGMSFTEIHWLMYKEHQALLLGVELPTSGGKTVTKLNPGRSYKFNGTERVFLCCTDFALASATVATDYASLRMQEARITDAGSRLNARLAPGKVSPEHSSEPASERTLPEPLNAPNQVSVEKKRAFHAGLGSASSSGATHGSGQGQGDDLSLPGGAPDLSPVRSVAFSSQLSVDNTSSGRDRVPSVDSEQSEVTSGEGYASHIDAQLQSVLDTSGCDFEDSEKPILGWLRSLQLTKRDVVDYFDSFSKEGLDSLQALRTTTLDGDDLERMGIKRGHRLLILEGQQRLMAAGDGSPGMTPSKAMTITSSKHMKLRHSALKNSPMKKSLPPLKKKGGGSNRVVIYGANRSNETEYQTERSARQRATMDIDPRLLHREREWAAQKIQARWRQGKGWSNAQEFLHRQHNIRHGVAPVLDDPLTRSHLASLHGHICVCSCAEIRTLRHFFATIRCEGQQDIVLLHPTVVSPEAHFHRGNMSASTELEKEMIEAGHVHQVNGSPMEKDRLQAINLSDTSAVVVMANPNAKGTRALEFNTTVASKRDKMLDAKTILAYLKICRLTPPGTFCLVEVLDPNSVQLFETLDRQIEDEQLSRVRLERRRDAAWSPLERVDTNNEKVKVKRTASHEIQFHLTDQYAQGRVYISSTMDRILAQTYFNGHTVALLQQLFSGREEDRALKTVDVLGRRFMGDRKKPPALSRKKSHVGVMGLGNISNRVRAVPVPHCLGNSNSDHCFYIDAVEHFAKDCLVVLGVYKAYQPVSDDGSPRRPVSIVVTNPEKTFKLRKKPRNVLSSDMIDSTLVDMIYVLDSDEGDKY